MSEISWRFREINITFIDLFLIILIEESLAAAAERKAKMQELDAERQAQVGLNDLEEETKKENEHLLENARRLRMEQEDEIKRLSELILSAKVQQLELKLGFFKIIDFPDCDIKTSKNWSKFKPRLLIKPFSGQWFIYLYFYLLWTVWFYVKK